MKHLAMAALVLNFGAAGIYAESVNVKVSGTAANSTVQLSGSPASEYNLAGEGFTFRVVNTNLAPPAVNPTTCPSPKLYFPVGAGAGVLRSQDEVY